jgi:hypothetical protein
MWVVYERGMIARSHTSPGVGSSRFARRAFFSLVAVLAGLSLVACGGTTGDELLPVAISPGGDATLPDAAVEASVGVDDDAATIFDSTVQYVDRVLPDVYVQPTQEDATASSLPSCAVDIPANTMSGPDGSIVAVPVLNGDIASFEIGAVFTADGGEAPAPEGSACATQVWLGSAACDECIKNQVGGGSMDPWHGEYGSAILPPCSDLYEAGAPTVGPGAGIPRYQLCWNLFNKIVATHCVTDPSNAIGPCICSSSSSNCLSKGGDGPAYQEELAALEIGGGMPGAEYLQATKALTVVGVAVGHAGGAVNSLFSFLVSNCQSSCPIVQAVDASSD